MRISMKTVEIAVCDDEQVHIDRIVKYIDVYSEESEININITSYNSGMALLKDIENDDLKYDIIFLDVEMPEINGVDMARQIRKITQDVIICFVTSFDKYAIQAYGVEALAYVVKPVAYAELKRVLSRAVVLVQYTFDYKEAEERYIEVPVSRNTRIVDVRTIQYIEKRRNKCVLHCTDAEITCYETLKEICSKLDQNIFIYVHQGYIVNFDAIKEVKENVVCLGDGVEVPLSRSHYKEVKNRHMSKIRKLLEERKM